MKVSSRLNLLIAAALMLSVVFTAQPAAAQPQRRAVAEMSLNSPFVPGEVVVGFTGGKTAQSYQAQAAELAQTMNGQLVGRRGNAALISFAEDADVGDLAARISGLPGVAFAEPNYIYSVPEFVQDPFDPSLQRQVVLRRVKPGPQTENKSLMAVPVQALKSMKSIRGGTVQATYPNDPYLWWNGGWDWVGASIVWPNATPSAGVCVLDTGVDYQHPDLGPVETGGVVVKGYDYVNGDTDPMDDFGHGTHVAGIIAARMNNKQGISGVSNGKVVAVKVLSSQGWGTSYDIAAGIRYCANRPDVKVLNLSLGGYGASQYIYDTIKYAVNTKGKLVVAAAGNSGQNDPYFFPARFSNKAEFPEFADKVISVAASGQVNEDPPGSRQYYVDYNCKADYSNYADWVTISAPGTWIYSTTPWDKPFYMNWNWGASPRYEGLDGTSMATPFVAGAAARRWGLVPAATNEQITQNLIALTPIHTLDYAGDGACWPGQMHEKSQVNVASLLRRGGMWGRVLDASTGLPLPGAQLLAYQGTALRGTGVVGVDRSGPYPWEQDPTRVYVSFHTWADVINLPVGGSYALKLNKTGYTAGEQTAFRTYAPATILGGDWTFGGATGVPPLSARLDAVLGWRWFWRWDLAAPDTFYSDLDMNVWLPNVPNHDQPAPFIVGPEGNSFGFLEGSSAGAMGAFPFARFKRDGNDWNGMIEDITIANRPAHGGLVANPALPYYPGSYYVMVTDWGQTIDHDNDPNTPPIPQMGVYHVPWLYIWKDGQIKFFTQMDIQDPGGTCNAHWWKAARITSSPASASPTYTAIGVCGDDTIVPYSGTVQSPPSK